MLVYIGALGLAAVAVAHPVNSPFARFESHRAPSTFAKLSTPVAPSHTIHLHIGLTRPNDAKIEEKVLALSNPNHAQYGQYPDDDAIAALTAPDSESVDAVHEWLASHGLSGEWSPSQDWVSIPAVNVDQVERMLDAKYALYRHNDGDVLLRTEAWSLPLHLHRHIEVIQPTTMFGRLRPSVREVIGFEPIAASDVASLVVQDDSQNACTNPARVPNLCLRQLYHTDKYVPQHPNENMLGITGYLGEYAQYRDLALFLQKERPDQAGYKFEVELPPGGVNTQGLNKTQLQSQTGLEANLDTQTCAGFTAPTKNIFYSTPGSPPYKPDVNTPTDTNEPYLTWLKYIQSLPSNKVPKVISTSYDDDEQTVPPSYAQRACKSFRDLGLKGVSVLFASGDDGVGKPGTCVSNDGKNKTVFLASFPASCPWVTSVGATQDFNPEVAVSANGPGGFYSGGGFSNYFTRPSYQQADVTKYVASLDGAYKGLYNMTGRGYPDVAAQGSKFIIAYNGSFVLVGGTSASTPTFSSVIALLNDVRISQNKPSLGFLNPWLYSAGRAGLNDILSGSSAGCGTDGFPAKTGWDAVSGLGTPNFEKLRGLMA